MGCCLILASCNTASPEKYFDEAVLNSNLIVGFADEGLSRELEMPSVKMSEANGEPVPMKRSEVISTRVGFIEEHYDRIKSLSETADARDILQASIALHEYVLKVYKKEYTELAMLYDQETEKDKLQSYTKAIHDKYYQRFDELYNDLISKGKLYAAKHSIKVNWAM